MNARSREALAQSRRALQNPYAHIEELESSAALQASNPADSALLVAIRSSRRLMEDPYAYVDDDGFSGISNAAQSQDLSISTPRLTADPLPSQRGGSARTARRDVAAEVRRIHQEVWRRRSEFLQGNEAVDPVDLLDPAIALALLDFKSEYAVSLGTFRKGSQLIEVAGLIDRPNKRVQVSLELSPPVRRFTLAHELAHAVMHPHLSGVHRDRPLDGSALARDMNEWEADRFATLFLQPERLVRKHFRSRFGTERFELTEATIVALGGEAVCGAPGEIGLRALSRLLAGAERFDGRQFCSLAEQFQVSRETMAIRIEELRLIDTHE